MLYLRRAWLAPRVGHELQTREETLPGVNAGSAGSYPAYALLDMLRQGWLVVVGGRGAKAKGSAGEREVRDILRERGYDAHRVPHSGALAWMPGDVDGLPGFHIEVKRQERVLLHHFVAQAEEECGDKIPLMVYRRSYEPWRVVLPFSDFLDILDQLRLREDE